MHSMPFKASVLFCLVALAAATAQLQRLSRQELEHRSERGVPIHGNWCGPYHGSGVCIDQLDCACKSHDLCYDKYGYFNCKCDNDLVDSIKSISSIKARAVSTWFSQSSCKGPVRILGKCLMSPVPGSLKRLVKSYLC